MNIDIHVYHATVYINRIGSFEFWESIKLYRLH